MMSGKYIKLDLIGEGTFGRAWLVRKKDTQKKYVVKEIRVQGMSDPEKDQTLTEVRALAKCKHVNVIRYREAFVEHANLCIAMEYADGGDFQKRITEQKGAYLEEGVVIDWIIQVFFALKYIHGINILHRDLKTQNIFLTRENIVKVGDFGIARFLQNTQDHASTVIGTPYYLSPEICQKKSYNYKSDMWAAGCILYELCTLRHPFDGCNISSLMVSILQGKFKPIPSHYGPLLDDLVSVLLCQDPEGRPSAEQALAIPAVQPYVNHYVKRTMTMKELQVNTPSPRRVKQKPRSREGSLDKENLEPNGKPKGSMRPKSCGTPPRAMPLTERKKTAGSAEVRQNPKQWKHIAQTPVSKAGPKVTLYQELLTKNTKGRQGGKFPAAEKNNPTVVNTVEHSVEPQQQTQPKMRKVCSKTYMVKAKPLKAGIPPKADIGNKKGKPKTIKPKCFNPTKEVYEDDVDSAISQIDESSIISFEPGSYDETSSGYSSCDSKGKQELPKLCSPESNAVYKLLYNSTAQHNEELFSKIETIKCFLEDKLGPHETTNYYSLIKDSVTANIDFNDMEAMLPPHIFIYFPAILQAVQLEIWLNEKL